MNILHKLGLYRKDEIDNILKWATEVSCTADKIAEVAKTPAHAVLVLKDHCYNQSDCTKCVFHDGKCKLAHTPPCWWKI